MSAGFTKGPWEFRLEAVRTVIFHKGEIGERAIAVGAGHYPDHVANARLIAAAPELYEALERCANFIANTESEMGVTLESGQLARAALAKARGEA